MDMEKDILNKLTNMEKKLGEMGEKLGKIERTLDGLKNMQGVISSLTTNMPNNFAASFKDMQGLISRVDEVIVEPLAKDVDPSWFHSKSALVGFMEYVRTSLDEVKACLNRGEDKKIG